MCEHNERRCWEAAFSRRRQIPIMLRVYTLRWHWSWAGIEFVEAVTSDVHRPVSSANQRCL